MLTKIQWLAPFFARSSILEKVSYSLNYLLVATSKPPILDKTKTRMYEYHGSSQHAERLEQSRCRCASTGTVYKLTEYVENGIILDPRKKARPLSTATIRKDRSEIDPVGSGYGKTFIFAVAKNLDVHVAPDSDRDESNAVKHETLFHNQHVLAAGEICIVEGKIVALNDISGSYKTDGELEGTPAFASAVLDAVAQHRLPLDDLLKERLTNLISP